jgi:hypothetical protein
VQGARAKNTREEKNKKTRNALFIFVSFGGYCANPTKTTSYIQGPHDYTFFKRFSKITSNIGCRIFSLSFKFKVNTFLVAKNAF